MSDSTTPAAPPDTSAGDGSAVWIVIQWKPDGHHEFQGVFGSEARAVEACRTDLHCVCPATVGVELGQATETWPGAWYPHRQPRPQNAAGQARVLPSPGPAGSETDQEVG